MTTYSESRQAIFHLNAPCACRFMSGCEHFASGDTGVSDAASLDSTATRL
jgi:hypothetical protein